MGKVELIMCADTLLVTGIHREELPFGDHVAALFDTDTIDIMRIPQGIPQARAGTRNPFYYDTQHREIYLQLCQQTKGRYRLLLDLHCGIDDTGKCADIFCHDQAFLDCLVQQRVTDSPAGSVRLIRIVETENTAQASGNNPVTNVHAHTWIPREVWNDKHCIYVGLEIYLRSGNEGNEEDWRFTRTLIENIRTCTG